MPRPLIHRYKRTAFARNLRQARLDAGLTQGELAAKSTVSQQAISAYECAHPDRQPSVEHVYLLATALRCTVFDLMPDLVRLVPRPLRRDLRRLLKR